MLALIRSMLPAPILKLYHYIMALSGAVYYGFPSRGMITIGVTGTSGKSSTVFLLGRILHAAGHKVGSSSTIEFCVGDECTLNKTKMTQLGRWGTQRLLAQMRRAGCDVAIVETTSQGIEQFRHVGIAYDVCVLTNLYPEHIEAHGSFENYKNAKKKLFAYLATRSRKKQFGVPKTAIVNGQVREASEFLNYSIERIWTTFAPQSRAQRVFAPENVVSTGDGITFSIDLIPFKMSLLGEHVAANATTAVAAANAIGVGLQQCADALAKITSVPGRIEFVSIGHEQPYTVIVDFAFEPVAMTKLYDVVEKIPHGRIIHVLGGTGGGRDKSRRPILGNIAGERAAFVVVTNEDPYDEDPVEIMNMVADGVRGVGKEIGAGLEIIPDRRAAIARALQEARERDIILITGKGCEQAIVGAQRTMTAWDDRAVAREEIEKISHTWAKSTASN